jgi:hypothetical protein
MATVAIFEADSEYAALVIQQSLLCEGIVSVIQSNQMPQEPGFNFGAGPWGFVLVESADAARAAVHAKEATSAFLGIGQSAKFPPALNFQTNNLLALMWLIHLCLIAVLASASLTAERYAVYGAHVLLLGILIFCFNWDRLSRSLFEAIRALFFLPVAAFMLLIELVNVLRKMPVFPAWFRRGEP